MYVRIHICMYVRTYMYVFMYTYVFIIYHQIQTKGMQVVADLTMSQFSTLFSGSLFWRSEVCMHVFNFSL